MADSAQSKRASAAARAQRYRDKKKQGLPIRQQRTAEQKIALLQQPYAELSEKDKELVRYYRKQARKQTHQVAAHFPPVGSTSSSISSSAVQLPYVSFQPTQRHYPLITLSAAAELSSL